uniref:Transmembrane protein 138 n=1 Tax=Timema poppense TaxID=170557 RepID=A0A7R9D5Z1_TIMPO|nr:unnamed protein product [Timema poppensis]
MYVTIDVSTRGIQRSSLQLAPKIQVVCLIFAVIVLVLSFFSTYAFQAGLVELLYDRFGLTLFISVVYLLLTIALNIWTLTSRWDKPLQFVWPTGLLALFVTQRLTVRNEFPTVLSVNENSSFYWFAWQPLSLTFPCANRKLPFLPLDKARQQWRLFSMVNKFIREVKSHANDSVLKQQISPFADNLAWRNCQGRCSESGNSRTAILKPGTCWLKTADKAREALMTLTNVYGVVSLPLAPRQQTLVNELSSPMASLVLTESSQLTYDSQDLAISCELSVSTKEAMGLLWLNWCHPFSHLSHSNIHPLNPPTFPRNSSPRNPPISYDPSLLHLPVSSFRLPLSDPLGPKKDA